MAYKRYEVQYPVDVGHSPGWSDDLEEAGRIYLATSGATDIYDHEERRYVHPEDEVSCVADAYETWAADQAASSGEQSQ